MKKNKIRCRIAALLFLAVLTVGCSNSDSTIWVVADHEVKKLAADGTVLVNLTSAFDKDFNFTNSPDILDISNDGYVWITDTNNDRIICIRPDGNPDHEINSAHPQGIATFIYGGGYVIWSSEPGMLKRWWDGGATVTVYGFSHDISAISIGANGSIWVSDRGNGQVVVLEGKRADLNGYDASALQGPHHVRYSDFSEPTDLVVNLNDDSEGANNVWVSDRQRGEAIKFSPRGLQLTRIRQSAAGDSTHISVNPFRGDIWMGTTGQTGGFISNFSASGDELISFPVDSITALAVDPADETLWLAGGENSAATLKKLTYSGYEFFSISCSGTIKEILISTSESPTQVIQPFYARVTEVDDPSFWDWEVGDYIPGIAVFDNARIHSVGDYWIARNWMAGPDERQPIQLSLDLKKWILTEEDEDIFSWIMGWPSIKFCNGTLCGFDWSSPYIDNEDGLEAFSFGRSFAVRSRYPEGHSLRGVFSLRPGPGPSLKITAQDGAERHYFGNSVAISGDLAIVGAYGDDESGMNSGSAYLFRKDGNNYVQEQKITAQNLAEGDRFGFSVSISDTAVLVGSYGDDENGTDSGAAYVFRHNDGNWVREQKLMPQDGAEGDKFGYAVSISGDLALVGAYGDDENGKNSGSVYVFKYRDKQWVQQQKLTARDGAGYDLFGQAVSISRTVALAGSYGNDQRGANSGAAYVFRWNGEKWVQEQKLIAPDGHACDNFGFAVSADGDTVLIGAKNSAANGLSSGSAYVFRYNGNRWVQEQKLLADDGTAGDTFGCAVSISGSTALVGAYGDDYGFSSGSAYLFHRDNDTWILEQKLIAPDSAAGDHFGYSVAVSGLTALAGAHFDDDTGIDSGSAYISMYDQDEDGLPDWR